MIGILATRAHLVALLLKREIIARTAGTFLGALWLVLQPALQVMAWWFLLGLILQVKLQSTASFVDYYLIGIVPWLMIADILNRNLHVLREYGPLYQKAIFPIETLPIVPVIVTAISYGGVYAIVVGLQQGLVAAIISLLLLAALLLWLLPFSYLFALTGLFLRDLAQIIQFGLGLMFYFTPVLYEPQMLPKRLQILLALNPFADWMAVFHGVLQNGPLSFGAPSRLLCWFFITVPPAAYLFRRYAIYAREAL